LTFFSGAAALRDSFAGSQAGVCLVPPLASKKSGKWPAAPAGMVMLEAPSVSRAFAAIAALFYPGIPSRAGRRRRLFSHARIGRDVELAPGVVIGRGLKSATAQARARP